MINDNRDTIRVAWISNYVPKIGRDGASTYALELLRYLAKSGCAIEYVCTSSGGKLPCYTIDRQLNGLVHLSIYQNFKFFNLCFRLCPLSDWPYSFALLAYSALPITLKKMYQNLRIWYQNKTQHQVLREIKCPDGLKHTWDSVSVEGLFFAQQKLLSMKPDVVIADYVWMAAILDAVGPETLKVILTYDVLHARIASFKAYNVDPGSNNWEYDTEARLLSKAQVLVAIQAEEAEILQKMVPDSEVITIP